MQILQKIDHFVPVQPEHGDFKVGVHLTQKQIQTEKKYIMSSLIISFSRKHQLTIDKQNVSELGNI